MAREVRIPPFEPHEGQQRMLSLRRRRKRNVACCGRRWGKTYALIELMLNRPGGALAGRTGTGRRGMPCAWYAPNDSFFTKVFQTIVDTYRGAIRRAPSSPRPTIEFINGGSVDFWTLENPMKCGRGSHYSRVIIDEAAHARHLQDAWEQTIEFTLADLDGDAWFISTPKGSNYFHELYKRAEFDSSEWSSHTAPSHENPYLPKGWMERKRLEMPSLVYAQEVLAEFVTFGAGLVKPEHIVEGVPRAGLPVVLGVDLAISERDTADYTSIAAMSRDPENGYVYLLEIERHRASFNDVLGIIKAAAARWKPTIIAIEQVQFQAAVVQELARTTHLPVRGVKPERDKLTRFLPMITRYEQRLVRHDPARIPAWFRDELLSFPEGRNDDGVDACSIAFAALPATQIQFSSNSPRMNFKGYGI